MSVAAPPRTREAWLLEAVDRLRPFFEEEGGVEIPDLLVSVGWPTGGRKVIGQCWPGSMTDDGRPQVFISPALVAPIDVLAVLVHELVHASGRMGHGSEFRSLALAVGLRGRMTATGPGLELTSRLHALSEVLGPYGHSELRRGEGGPVAKQSTRMLKVACPGSECPCGGYTVRTTRKWLDLGLPSCPFGTKMVQETGGSQ